MVSLSQWNLPGNGHIIAGFDGHFFPSHSSSRVCALFHSVLIFHSASSKLPPCFIHCLESFDLLPGQGLPVDEQFHFMGISEHIDLRFVSVAVFPRPAIHGIRSSPQPLVYSYSGVVHRTHPDIRFLLKAPDYRGILCRGSYVARMSIAPHPANSQGYDLFIPDPSYDQAPSPASPRQSHDVQR